MGSGGSGAGAGGGGYSGGGLANTGGTGYGGDLGGYGTAGEKSSGAGGSAMSGYGNTGAGGSGMAGISNISGYTSPGFTPAYGDPRGLSIGMDAFGNYKGTPGYAGIGAPGKPTTMSPAAQTEMFGYVKYPSNVVPQQTFSTTLPTQTAGLFAPNSVLGTIGFPSAPPSPFGGVPGSIGMPTGTRGLPSASNRIGSSLGGMAGNPAGGGLPGGTFSGSTRGTLGGGFSGSVGNAGPRGMSGSPAGRRI